MSHAQGAALFSAYLAGLAVASLVLVPLTDRHPPERFFLLGVLVMGVSHVLFAMLAGGFASAFLLRVLGGAGHVAAYFPGIRLVSDRFAGGARGTAVAALVGAGYLGTTLSYTVTGTLLARSDTWQAAYLETSLLGLGAVPLAYLVGRKRDRASRPWGPSTGALTLAPLRDRALRLVILAYALHSAELYLARLWLPLLLGTILVASGIEPLAASASAASLAGLMFLTGIAGIFLGGPLSDRVGRSAAAMSCFALSGACSFLIGWLLSWPPVATVVVGFVYGFATAADSSIYATAVTELAPPESLGSAQAVQSFAGFLAGALAPLLGGFVLDAAPAGAVWPATFGLNGLFALAGLLALRALRRTPRAAVLARGRR